MLNRTDAMETRHDQSIEISAAIAMLSQMTSIQHEFDCFPAGRNGGPLRHVLEIGNRLLLAWFDDLKSVVVVTPLECWDVDMWAHVDDDLEPIPVLSFKEIDGATFQMMAASAGVASPFPILK